MEKSWNFPTLDEINKYYNPGNMSCPLYCQQSFSRTSGKVEINPQNISPFHGSLSYHLRHNINPQRASRVIFVEDEQDLERIITAIHQSDLIPIRMEPTQ